MKLPWIHFHRFDKSLLAFLLQHLCIRVCWIHNKTSKHIKKHIHSFIIWQVANDEQLHWSRGRGHWQKQLDRWCGWYSLPLWPILSGGEHVLHGMKRPHIHICHPVLSLFIFALTPLQGTLKNVYHPRPGFAASLLPVRVPGVAWEWLPCSI